MKSEFALKPASVFSRGAAYFGHFYLRDEGWFHEPDHPVRAIMPPFQGGKSVASVAH
jgi:hypothetical protein